MLSRKRWEPWEDALVLEGERTREADIALAREICRSPNAVRVHRARIASVGRPHERWTPEEDEAVTDHYARFCEFCESIGRTSHHVMERGAILARRRAAG